MKFTDGFWLMRPGVHALYAQEAYRIEANERSIDVLAPTKAINGRGDTLNRPTLTVTLSSPQEGVIRVRIDHFRGGNEVPRFVGPATFDGTEVTAEEGGYRLTAGNLAAVVRKGGPWSLSFEQGGKPIVWSGHKSVGYVTLAHDAAVSPAPGEPMAYMHEQLSLDVGEVIYGLGERFGPLVKNGQSIDIWNADGGTSSEQAYKNVPFYVSSKGYGVLVNDPGHVSFEVGSEAVERVQFSVPGESLEYFVIAGPSPADVIDRYTRLVGRPARVPAWSYGLWLSTSFTTNYDEATVTSFVQGMAERDIPMSVFHFDCFWMRGFHWSDFIWDPEVFPDPEGMLARLHDRGLKVSVWINPYIAQQSKLFEEAKTAGYLLRRPNGDVWQWDLWQAGMALVDFTNPDATRWFQGKLRQLLRQGVDVFKTDFAERIPIDSTYFDGSDPTRMHNLYTLLYNRAVFDVLQERERGGGFVFARSATVGSQSLPVHWSGDSTSSFESMAETLRGGLSLAWSGFAFWSHDIGGFEGTPDAAVFKRWLAFGMLSSHSRLHGSDSYRVPWAFDEEAVDVARKFTQLKLRLMPYLFSLGEEAITNGIPLLRPMALEFPEDPAVQYLDRQYMLGPDLLVAPVFTESGEVDFYLPQGRWQHLLSGKVVDGGSWRREHHGFDSVPLYVREGAVIPFGKRNDRPDYPYLDGLQLVVTPPAGDAERSVTVLEPEGRRETFTVTTRDGVISVSGPAGNWSVTSVGGTDVPSMDGLATLLVGDCCADR